MHIDLLNILFKFTLKRINKNGADDWSRTSTSEETTPSRWRVYQFHHIGVCYIILFFGQTGVLPVFRIAHNRPDFLSGVGGSLPATHPQHLMFIFTNKIAT